MKPINSAFISLLVFVWFITFIYLRSRTLNVCASSFCFCAWFVNMVRVAKLKSRQRKFELARTMAAASAVDIASAALARATAWATAASQAHDAALALYDLETNLSSSSSFNLERFLATADAVDKAKAAFIAAAKVLATAKATFG